MEDLEQEFIGLDLPDPDSKTATIKGRIFTFRQYVRLRMHSGRWSNWPDSPIGGNNSDWGATLFTLHDLSPRSPVGRCDLRKESSRSIGEGTDEAHKGEQTILFWSHVQGWNDRSPGGGFELIVDGQSLIKQEYQPNGVSPSQRFERRFNIEVI